MPVAISSVTYRYKENCWTIIMTALFFPLLVKGFNATLPVPNDESHVTTSAAFMLTTASPDSDAIYLWVPLIIVIIFAMIITTLIIVGRQTRRASCKCLGVSSSLDSSVDATVTNPRRNLTLNINLAVNSTDPNVPETPPPSYAVISRQISSISTISQTSSQIEIPPGYDEAVNIPDGTDRRTKRRVGSQQSLARGSVSSQTQVSKGSGASRFRLFSRSSSASESSRRPPLLRQTSTPQDFRGLGLPADTVPEHPELEHVDAPLTPTTLEIIHESSTGTEDVHPDNQIGNNGVSRFYIDEAEMRSSSTS